MGACTVLRTFSVWSPWEVNAQEEMGVTGVRWPAQGHTARAQQSGDWNPSACSSEAVFASPTKCSHPAAVAASCGLSDRWFLLWSYICFHFLSAITSDNPGRELTCRSQNKTWDLCRADHRLVPAWAAGIVANGETKSGEGFPWAPHGGSWASQSPVGVPRCCLRVGW